MKKLYIAVLTGLLLWLVIRQFSLKGSVKADYEPIPFQVRDGKTFVASDLHHVTKPLLFKNLPAISSWKASEWTPAYISTRAAPFYRVYSHTQKNFLYYDEEKEFSSYLLPIFHKNRKLFTILQEKKIDPHQFFTKVYSQTKPYWYYSQNVAYLGPKLAGEAGDMKFLKVTNTSLSSNVWIGRGSITQMHYDASYNCFVQLYGRKKFTVYPPEYWIDLNLYSSLHPSHRQSQMEHPIIPGKAPYEVILGPGDLLYLPPYWFHHVEALSDDISISINAWTDCDDYFYSKALSHLPLPIEGSWSKTRQIHAISDYISDLHEQMVLLPDALIKEHSISKYIDRFILQRYDIHVIKNVFHPTTSCMCIQLTSSYQMQESSQNTLK